ncbi:MAG TPA: hypothetical protein VGI38_08755 [Puia sp.]|jgi:uncharacterized membrane protein YgcG
MKRPYIFIIAALSFFTLNSCSVYRNNPTPDDVYYSPGTPAVSTSSAQNNNSDYYSTPNDNYVKMRVQNPDKWSYFDDYNYDYYGGGYAPYSPYASGVGLGIGFSTGYYSPYYGGFGYYSPLSYYNSYYAWNNFYNPYYGGVIVVNGKNNATPSYTRMSNFNPSAYQGNYYNSRPSTNFVNANGSQNSTNSNNFNRSTNNRPSFNNSNYSPMRSSPSNFSGGGGGGGGASRGGGFSRPGR